MNDLWKTLIAAGLLIAILIIAFFAYVLSQAPQLLYTIFGGILVGVPLIVVILYLAYDRKTDAMERMQAMMAVSTQGRMPAIHVTGGQPALPNPNYMEAPPPARWSWVDDNTPQLNGGQ